MARGISAAVAAGTTKTDLTTTAFELFAENTSRSFVHIQNQSSVAMRLEFGGTLPTTTAGFRLLPGESWIDDRTAAAEVTIIAESGSSKVVWYRG